MRVVHFITSVDRAAGGVSTSVSLLSSEEGKNIECYLVSAPSPNPVEIANTKVIFAPGSLWTPCRTSRGYERILREIKPDLVHVHGIWEPQCWWFQRAAQRLGIKVVLSPHGMLEPWILRRHRFKKNAALALYQRRAVRRADYIHATAETERDNIMSLGLNGLVETVPNGIDLSQIAMRTDWNANRNILYLSRIHVKKGIEVLIEAASALRDRLAGYEITIAGEGDADYVASLEELVRSKGLESIFRFTGGIYDEQKWEAYRRADTFVLPTFSENFGNVIVESLASGTPVITTWGAPWEELETDRCGWWIDLSEENLVEAMRRALAVTPAQREEMGRRGRALVERRYTIEQCTLQMIELYKKVTGK